MEEGKRLRRQKKKRYMTLAAIIVLAAVYFLIHKFTQLPAYIFSSAFADKQFCTDEGNIQYKNGRVWEDFQVRGINFTVSSAVDADYDFYEEWIKTAGEMNANTIRVDRLMDPEFYHAFADYNKGSSRPLYLFQDIAVNQDALKKYTDAGEARLEEKLIKEAKDTIDAVHGSLQGEGYRYSVSEYIIGFIVGQSWDDDFIIYTNRTEKGGSYKGSYISTSEHSTAFENILAKTMNAIFAYDTGKYRSQHLVAFGNEHNTDNLVHRKQKVNSMDANRVGIDENTFQPRDKVKTGIFAAYQVDVGVSEEFNYEPYYTEYITESGENSPYQGYLDELKETHKTMPVVITGFGLSTARGSSGKDIINGYDRGGLTEEKQAEGLAVLYQNIVDAGLSGGCIIELFDNPDRTAWNTEKYVDEEGVGSWINVQDSEQGLGLIKLVSAKEKDIAIDGVLADWSNEKPYLENGENKYYIAYDEKYVYIAGSIKNYNEQQDKVYLAFDTNPNSGAEKDKDLNLSFDREADFLLSVSGRKGASLLVQEYYDAVLALDPDVAETDSRRWNIPEKDSSTFQEIQQFVQRKTFFQNDPDVSVEELARRLQETGSMYEDSGNIVEECGVFNEKSGDYACTPEGFEIRVPWMLLNFSDPSQMKILNDLYSYEQLETIQIQEMYIQSFLVQNGSTRVSDSAKINLKGWKENVSYDFEKKAAYEQMQKMWAPTGGK